MVENAKAFVLTFLSWIKLVAVLRSLQCILFSTTIISSYGESRFGVLYVGFEGGGLSIFASCQTAVDNRRGLLIKLRLRQ